MNGDEITINYDYESRLKGSIKCKRNEKLKEVFKKIANELNVKITNIYFLLAGNNFEQSDYEKEIGEFCPPVNDGILGILVKEKSESEIERLLQNEKIKVTFWFDSKPENFEGLLSGQIRKICEQFANKVQRKINFLNFIYKNNILDLTKTIEEIADLNDINGKKIDIKVEEINVSFCLEYKKQIIIISSIIGIIVIAFIIILPTVILKKSKENKNPDVVTVFQSCLVYINSTTGECEKCVDEYLLNDRKCLPYIFHAKYQVDYYHENIKLFNPEKINDIYSMKINSQIIDPISEYDFNIIGINEIYFYYLENVPISLSNMYESIDKLISIQFNKYDIQDFIITDMKNMFNGCTSLTSISFNYFKSQNIDDMSYLFCNCSSLVDVDLENLNTNNVKDMSHMFYGCNKLATVNIGGFNTENVEDMSYMFYNCNKLASLDLSKFYTHNVNNMSNMFYNCSSLN